MVYSVIFLLQMASVLHGHFVSIADIYNSKDMRICLFGTVNYTHSDLRHIAVPKREKEGVDGEKAGCGIDVSKCTGPIETSSIRFGSYQGAANLAFFKYNPSQYKELKRTGFTNDVGLLTEYQLALSPWNILSDIPTQCVTELDTKLTDHDLRKINRGVSCPKWPATGDAEDVSDIQDGFCKLTILVDTEDCKSNITQNLQPDRGAENIHLSVSNTTRKFTFYCTGSFCPWQILGAQAWMNVHIPDSECLPKLSEQIAQMRTKYNLDKKICETFENNKNDQIMDGNTWKELVKVYKCEQSTVKTPATPKPTVAPSPKETTTAHRTPFVHLETTTDDDEDPSGSEGMNDYSSSSGPTTSDEDTPTPDESSTISDDATQILDDATPAVNETTPTSDENEETIDENPGTLETAEGEDSARGDSFVQPEPLEDASEKKTGLSVPGCVVLAVSAAGILVCFVLLLLIIFKFDVEKED